MVTVRSLAPMLAKRIAVMMLLLVVVSFAVFLLLYLSPGDVVDTLLGTNPRNPAIVATLRHQYHLDDPFWTQYWTWAKGAIHLDFGNSVQTTLPVTDELKARLPTSLFLGVYAYVLTMLLGIGLGMVAALRRRTIVDRGIVASSIVALGTPAFVSGVFLLYLFAVVMHVFPAFGSGSGFVDRLWHLTLPAIALALAGGAYVLKHARSAMLGVVEQDYVTFARARGLSGRRVLLVYILRNALIPVVTVSGVILAFVITGAVLVEQTFSLPGLGQLLVQSAVAKDVPMIQGVAIVIAVVIMVANLATDLLYAAVDPRVRVRRQAA